MSSPGVLGSRCGPLRDDRNRLSRQAFSMLYPKGRVVGQGVSVDLLIADLMA
ncbi:hypothetical protein GTA30_21090, partial [Roseobacter sp. HKCCD6503]|nr:hypothetical protein [Roseobacter sp. HKCCD9117-2]NNX32572.1 hypothetical protein [Roseobacter sp. HKCCD6503]NNZ83832.1 hypothetical protein [Roseobacter sp. HKCCD7538]NOB32774.1 hypothetical protein [Roseobacter sp. HKCCD6543]NOD19984.1 hypothetical protein [Roseobacter sp. HKCCD7580]